MKIYLDPGHGGSDPGAVGNGLQEKEVVLDIAKRIENLLQGYSNTSVKMSRTSDVSKSLSERTNEANRWGANIYLSIHCNAFNGKVRGYEDFIYNRLDKNAVSKDYQTAIHHSVSKQINIPNRGMKQANFHVLRKSTMPAILTENGFIDHPLDAALMKQSSWRESVATAHVEGLVKIFNLKRKNTALGEYSVIAGSFQSRTNAESRSLLLEATGFPSKILQANVKGNAVFRVQSGRYPSSNAAKDQVRKLQAKGIQSFILKGEN
ncbi:N-acetylmuramoyl-L-alanine amidase [Oceanobacillus sp. CAU 1775]